MKKQTWYQKLFSKEPKYEIVQWETGLYSLRKNTAFERSYYDMDNQRLGCEYWWYAYKNIVETCTTNNLDLLRQVKQELIEKDIFIEKSTKLRRIVEDD